MTNQKARTRIDGIDHFMLQRATQEILCNMQINGWTQGEAEALPKYLENAIRKNGERLEKLKPFVVCEFDRQSY